MERGIPSVTSSIRITHFYAQALGSEFNGTWETASPDHYQVTYRNRNDINNNETLTEQMLYDSKTDEIYFPPHRRVV